MDSLETTICEPGTHFTLTSEIKDGTFVPGSVGFMAMVLGPECTCPNVLFYKTVITRRGKGGKDRLEQAMLLSPIFKLPGVPHEFLIPENEGRKYFVDIAVTPDPTNLSCEIKDGSKVVFEQDGIGMNDYVGCIRAKTLFLRELDKTTKVAKHALAEKIGTSGVIQSIWPNKPAVLNTFDRNAEFWYCGGSFNDVRDEFCTSLGKKRLFEDIHRTEAMLMIPAMEYNKKVEEVALNALSYIMEKLNSAEGKKLKNVDQLITLTKNTIVASKAKKSFIMNAIDKRMNCIYKNREQLKCSGPF